MDRPLWIYILTSTDDIYGVTMKNPPTAPSGSSVNLAYNASSDHSEEGSFIYLRGTTGYYYLFFSAGACCGYDTSKPAAGLEYSIRVCRSTSVAGPYVDANGASCKSSGGTVVLASHDNIYGPGGQGILVDTTYGGAVLYYHYGECFSLFFYLFFLFHAVFDTGSASANLSLL